MVIVRMLGNNGEWEDTFSQWTEGYVKVESREWIEEQIPGYCEALRTIPWKHGFGSDITDQIVARYKMNARSDLAAYLSGEESIRIVRGEDEELPEPTHLGELTNRGLVRLIACVDEIVNLSLYSYLVQRGAEPVQVFEFDSLSQTSRYDPTYLIDSEFIDRIRGGQSLWDVPEVNERYLQVRSSGNYGEMLKMLEEKGE